MIYVKSLFAGVVALIVATLITWVVVFGGPFSEIIAGSKRRCWCGCGSLSSVANSWAGTIRVRRRLLLAASSGPLAISRCGARYNPKRSCLRRTLLKMSDTGEVTRLLGEIGSGKKDAMNQLLPLVYDAASAGPVLFRRERGEHTLQPTALVHEAYIRHGGSEIRDADAGAFSGGGGDADAADPARLCSQASGGTAWRGRAEGAA